MCSVKTARNGCPKFVFDFIVSILLNSVDLSFIKFLIQLLKNHAEIIMADIILDNTAKN